MQDVLSCIIIAKHLILPGLLLDEPLALPLLLEPVFNYQGNGKSLIKNTKPEANQHNIQIKSQFILFISIFIPTANSMYTYFEIILKTLQFLQSRDRFVIKYILLLQVIQKTDLLSERVCDCEELVSPHKNDYGSYFLSLSGGGKKRL